MRVLETALQNRARWAGHDGFRQFRMQLRYTNIQTAMPASVATPWSSSKEKKELCVAACSMPVGYASRIGMNEYTIPAATYPSKRATTWCHHLLRDICSIAPPTQISTITLPHSLLTVPSGVLE